MEQIIRFIPISISKLISQTNLLLLTLKINFKFI